MEQDVGVIKYIIRFGLSYTIGVIAISVIFHIFDLEYSTGASIGVLFGAALYSVGNFIQENRRVPSKNEKTKMVWAAFVVSWLTSTFVAFVGVFILAGNQGLAEISQLISQLNISVAIGVSLFVSLLYLAILYYSYGGLAQKQYDGLKKRGKI